MAEWTIVDLNHAKNTYVDMSDIRKNGTIVKMWEMTDYKLAKKNSSGASFLSVRVLKKYDCEEVRSSILGMTAFSDNMANGEVVFSFSVKDTDADWDEIAPNTILKVLWKTACGKK
jgi:hypothetical protein